MYKEILEVRHTSPERDVVNVLFVDDDGNNQEVYLEVGSDEYQQVLDMGITEEAIIEQTATFKKESLAELSEIARQTAGEVYQQEIENLKNQVADLKQKSIKAYAHRRHVEQSATEKLKAVNKYVVENLTSEKIETAVPNLILAIHTLNEDETAINFIKNSNPEAKDAKTLFEALQYVI